MLFANFSKRLYWFFLILATPLYFLLTHYLAVFPHEYMHSLVATLAGFKKHFWNIHYGGSSLKNLLLLSNIDSNVNYSAMYAEGKNWLVGLTGFAGPGIGNGLTYLISYFGMKKQKTCSNKWFYYFFFWWNVNSIGNFIDYVPSRTFASHGDMAYVAHGFNVSPWLIMVVLGYPVLWSVIDFYKKTMPRTFDILRLKNNFMKLVLLVAVTLLLFLVYGTVGLKGYGLMSNFMSRLSI